MRFSTIQEVQKSKSVEAGQPIVLHCEVSDSTGQVSWFKDGLQLLPQSGVVVQSEGTKRTLILQSSGFSTSGVYSCKTADDIIEFYVDIKGDIRSFFTSYFLFFTSFHMELTKTWCILMFYFTFFYCWMKSSFWTCNEFILFFFASISFLMLYLICI